MKIDRVKVGELRTNVWLIEGIPEEAGQTPPLIVVDPGADADKIIAAIDERPVAAVLLTHGHFDHIGAADEVADETSSFLHMSEPEVKILPKLCADIYERYGIACEEPRVDFKFNDGEIKELAGLQVTFMVTPGHTIGSSGFLVSVPQSGQKHYFSGDTLFARDVGRTDLTSGCQEAMEKTIERLAKELDPSTKVYPGHGSTTSIERESAANSWWPSS
jgi:glyoxylase-like metal-dependent hydrolase (beta-lactamase superfamily II)